jgi:hypothetical protein
LKRFFDSSVLIPAFYKFDAHHDSSAKALLSASREDSFCALRTLGEVSETIVGGAAYEALIARCAIKAQADVLLTWNTRDFTRFGADISRLVKTPLDAPSIGP